MMRARLAALLMCWSLSAAAHLMVAQHGTVNLVGDKAYVVVSLPVSTLPNIDDDGDGKLSTAELQKHRSAIDARLTAGLRFSDGTREGRFADMMLSISPPDDRPGQPASQLVLLSVVQFESPPKQLHFSTDLFGNSGDEQLLKITTTRGSETDVAMLTPNTRTHVFFSSAGQTFVDYLRVGVEHILLGFDHLLFLFALLIAGGTILRHVAILTAFTIAHGTTCTLAALGWVQAPSAIVEPLIAASIVAVAVAHLAGMRLRTSQEVALVFVFGLVHGLGFASAMAEHGLDATFRLVSLAGFNIGIELGQGVVAVVILLAVAAIRRWAPPTLSAAWQRPAMFAVLLCSSYWLVERVVGV